MNRFQKLSSIVFLLLALIYPPAFAEAKDNTVNNVLEQGVDAQTQLAGEQSEELLLAHRHTRRRYHRRQRHRQYYQRYRNRHHYHRRRYRSTHYRGQPYRYGQWELVRDRHGRLMYDWQR
ncbi:hypothetical protein H6G41_29280 [Tolypothrix sp. FACHB-123]|uniref:hypothetical protein n=1 Tax=Tolypothrix sp. FACHB-123 TaxID=2692868 RepID=UPI0016828D0F|nr:hypothetical protein [Tolypothrix sp. FACHB-123]MBD2358653.1 hypothetical protein [Tolypothrix sp. FACHB-123]